MPGRQYPPGAPNQPGPHYPFGHGRPLQIVHPAPSATTQPAAPAASASQQPSAPPAQAVVPASALPPSLLDKPPQSPLIHLSDQLLTVTANNSSLSEILKDLASSSGMTVDGLDKDLRVFGVYGPGNPRDILTSLLDGGGYNFVMVGATSAGTPRAIVLTNRTNVAVSNSPSSPSSQQDQDDDQPLTVTYPSEESPPVQQPPVEPRQPRSPAEMLQELQRLRQQQQQQQQQQPPQ